VAGKLAATGQKATISYNLGAISQHSTLQASRLLVHKLLLTWTAHHQGKW